MSNAALGNHVVIPTDSIGAASSWAGGNGSSLGSYITNLVAVSMTVVAPNGTSSVAVGGGYSAYCVSAGVGTAWTYTYYNGSNYVNVGRFFFNQSYTRQWCGTAWYVYTGLGPGTYTFGIGGYDVGTYCYWDAYCYATVCALEIP